MPLGREREHNPRFVALRSHYGFDSFFCLPAKPVISLQGNRYVDIP